MALTYAGDPAASNLAWCRHRTGDTTAGLVPSLTDAEWDAEISNAGGNKYLAARNGAKALRARLARTVSGGPETAFRSSLFEQFDALIDDLEAEIAAGGFGGGIEQADVDAERDDDTVLPAWTYQGKDDNA